MTTPETGIVVTLGEIYAEVRDVSKTVGRVDTHLTDFRAEVTAKLADHETRIRADEANRWPLPNIVALATVSGSAIALAALALSR